MRQSPYPAAEEIAMAAAPQFTNLSAAPIVAHEIAASWALFLGLAILGFVLF
jgi:hypothetical protein